MSAKFLRHPFVVLAILVSTGCILPSDPGPPKDVGVSRGAAGIFALYNPCRNSRQVAFVTLFVTGGKIGSSDDSPIWRIVARGEAAPLTNFVVGEEPPGFETSVELDRVPTDLALALEVERPRASRTSRVAFRVSELREGYFLLAGSQYLPLEEYRVADTCQLNR